MANIYDMADTWNNGATVFAAIKMDVTDTASAAGSALLDLRVGGAKRVEIVKTGAIESYNAFTDTSNYERAFMRWNSNRLDIGTEAAGTGTVRSLLITGGGASPGGMLCTNAVTTLGWSVAFTGSTVTGTRRAGLFAEANNVLRLNGTSDALGGAFQLQEMTAPSAPGANLVRIYAEDNGGGKTRLMALFNTGAAQQIAIEP